MRDSGFPFACARTPMGSAKFTTPFSRSRSHPREAVLARANHYGFREVCVRVREKAARTRENVSWGSNLCFASARMVFSCARARMVTANFVATSPSHEIAKTRG